MTLVEALIVLLVGSLAMLGFYGLVETSNKLTKQQTEVVDLQQSARIGVAEFARIIRQSRVGGLYFGNAVLPIANNSPGGTSVPDISGASHFIRKGTDVIEVRGVLLGDKNVLDEGDVTCSGSCSTTTQITVTIPATTTLGFVNFPTGGTPSLSTRTKPFYFVVQDGENQQMVINGSTYLVPIYVVGLVDTTGTWYTTTASAFTFNMNPQNAGAQKLNATATLPATLAKSTGGGPIDVIRFFADEGPIDATGSNADTPPSLPDATPDPASRKYHGQTPGRDRRGFQNRYRRRRHRRTNT